MLLLQTYAKRIIFFGLVISCSITIASAMTDASMTDDAKVSQGVGKKAPQTPDVKNVVVFAQDRNFYTSVAQRVAMLQQEKLRDEVIVSIVAQEILAQGINVNEMYWSYGNNQQIQTPLHMAAGSGNLLVLKILLAAGDKRIDELSFYKESALRIALDKRQYAVATFLVCDAKASVDTAPKILTYAAAQGLDKVVEKLKEIWGQDKFRIAANTIDDDKLPIEWAEFNRDASGISGQIGVGLAHDIMRAGCERVIGILQPFTDDKLRKKPEKNACNSGCHCNTSAW